jgi:uncharacterized protein YecE (DUF72 family)
MIKLGTCGFSFKDWKGVVYPSSLKDGEALRYYSASLGLGTVEIDVSYYTLLPRKTVETWLSRTPPDFLFSVKLHKDMTGNEKRGDDDAGLPDRELFKRYLFSFEPLLLKGRLISFLAQFGPLFRKSERSMERLRGIRREMGSFPLVVEFRHNSWLLEEAREEVFAFLKENNLLYAIVDLPAVGTLPPFVPRALGPLAYFRLHGRNREWFRAGREERYHYHYNDAELAEFIPSMRAMEEKSLCTLVYFNNCHAGAALRNALRLKDLLDPEGAPQKAVTYVQGTLNLSLR